MVEETFTSGTSSDGWICPTCHAFVPDYQVHRCPGSVEQQFQLLSTSADNLWVEVLKEVRNNLESIAQSLEWLVNYFKVQIP